MTRDETDVPEGDDRRSGDASPVVAAADLASMRTPPCEIRDVVNGTWHSGLTVFRQVCTRAFRAQATASPRHGVLPFRVRITRSVGGRGDGRKRRLERPAGVRRS